METHQTNQVDEQRLDNVVIILDDQRLGCSSNEYSMLRGKFSETSLDFLYKKTLIYLAKKFDRTDFVSLFPHDRDFILYLMRNNCAKPNEEIFSDIYAEFYSDEEMVAELLIRDFIHVDDLDGNDLVDSPSFLRRVVPHGLLLNRLKLYEKDMAIQIVLENPKYFKSLHKHLRGDRDIARAAFSKCGSLIKGTTLTDDREMVLIALENDGSSYKYISTNLQFDMEIINISMRDYPALLENLPISFYQDCEFSERAVLMNPKVFQGVPQSMDLDFVKKVMQPKIIRYFTSHHLKDGEIRSKVEDYLREDPNLFADLHKDLQKDKPLALIAIEGDPNLVRHLVLYDYDCCRLAITKSWKLIRFCPIRILEDNFDLVRLAVELGGVSVFDVLHSSLTTNPQYAKQLIETCPRIYHELSTELRNDEEISTLYQQIKKKNPPPPTPTPHINTVPYLPTPPNPLESEKDMEEKQIPTPSSSQLFKLETSKDNLVTSIDFSNVKPFSLDPTTMTTSFKFGTGTLSNQSSSNSAIATTSSLTNPFSSTISTAESGSFSRVNPFSLDTTTSFKFGSATTPSVSNQIGGTTTLTNPFSLKPASSSGISSNPFLKPISVPQNNLKNINLLSLEGQLANSQDTVFVKERLAKDPFLFKYCHESLKKDKDFILDLLKSYTGGIFQYVDDSLKQDKEFVMKCIPISVMVSKFVDPQLRSDKEIVYLALKTSPLGYIYFNQSELFNGDKDIAYRAVKSNPSCLKTISVTYFKDPKFVFQLYRLMFRKKKYIKSQKSLKNTTRSSATLQKSTRISSKESSD